MTGGVQEANGMRVAEELLRANGVIPPDPARLEGVPLCVAGGASARADDAW